MKLFLLAAGVALAASKTGSSLKDTVGAIIREAQDTMLVVDEQMLTGSDDVAVTRAMSTTATSKSSTTTSKFIFLAEGLKQRGGARCVDPFGLRFPLVDENFANGAGPWHCDEWHWDAAGRLLSGYDDSMCLSADHLGIVRGFACTGTVGSLHGECNECSQWVWTREGAVSLSKDAGWTSLCLESTEPCQTPLTSYVGRMRPCQSPLSLSQTWSTWKQYNAAHGKMRAWEFPDCTEEEAAVTARLEKLSMKVLQDDLASETDSRQAPEMMEPSTHVSHYRDFSDVYEAVPISYLTGISESHRNTAQGKEFHRLFEVDEIFTNTSNPPPPNVISWALFIPRPAPAGKEHIYGPTSREENSYIRKEKAAPTSLKEAKTGTNYHKDSFFGKYVRRMIESHAKVSKRLLSWRVRIHLAPGLHFFVPIFLELGNIEVYLMKGPSIRTSGALWRWLPFADRTIPGAVVALDSDDTKTAFKNWPAVQSWERTSLSHLRWVHGWDTAYYKNWVPYDDWEKQHEKPGCSANKGQKWHGGEVRKWIATDKTYVPTYGVDVPVESRASRDADHPKFCGCHNYAPAQANFVGAKPRLLTYSFKDVIIGWSLRRAINGWSDRRWYPHASKRIHAFNHGYGGHAIGWGKALFDYGFDEAFTKGPFYFRSVAEGGLYSLSPASKGVLNPMDTMDSSVDHLGLRCRNAHFLDLVWIARHRGNVIESMKTRSFYKSKKVNAALSGLGLGLEELHAQNTKPRMLWPCRRDQRTLKNSAQTPHGMRFNVNEFGCITHHSGHVSLESASAYPYLAWTKTSAVCVASTDKGFDDWGKYCQTDAARDTRGLRHCEPTQFRFGAPKTWSKSDPKDWNKGVSGSLRIAMRHESTQCAEATALGHIKFTRNCDDRVEQEWTYDQKSQTLSVIVPTVTDPLRRMCLTVSSDVEKTDQKFTAAAANVPHDLVPLNLDALIHECIAPPTRDKMWKACGKAGEMCVCAPGSLVRIGRGVLQRETLMPKRGKLLCHASSFGGIDPMGGIQEGKTCGCRTHLFYSHKFTT